MIIATHPLRHAAIMSTLVVAGVFVIAASTLLHLAGS
jgi:hypothetical protein